MNSEQLTTNMKLISAALELSRRDIVKILSFGGLDVTVSHIDKWFRNKSATKNATGNSDMAGMRINRAGTITDAEFRAFCVGLKEWVANIDSPE